MYVPIRDMFIFSTFTGICHCDMMTLSENHLKRDDNGRLWIMTTRQKSGTPENVLLLDVAINLIEKYRGLAKDGLLFPMLTKESMNIHLKKIAKLCGIERSISYHDSRHTFATQVLLSQGVPIETVSRAMGHKNISTTQRYAKITHEKVDRDVDILSGRLGDSFSLNGIDSPPSTILKDMSNRKYRPSKRLLTSNGE
ncbi:MAG: site-specific integrase [Rikenellaceae bacterium]